MKKFFKIILSFIMIICACIPLSACNEPPKKYDIKVNVWYANYGFVDGDGTYEENTYCTITALPKADSKFLAWMNENVIVSYDATFTFKVSKETSGTYTAIFTCPDLELVTPTKINFKDNYENTDSSAIIKANVKLGSSYDNLKEIFDGEINTKKTFDIDSLTMALNKKTKIYCEINITYSYEDVVDGEIAVIDSKAQTYLEIELNEQLLSKEYKINLPKNLNGETYISFEFQNFTVPEEDNAETA